MTTAAEFLPTLDSGLAWMTAVLGPKPPVNDAARVLLLAIAGQDAAATSTACRRWQLDAAHSYFQMERAGGVTGVLTDPASAVFARELCAVSGECNSAAGFCLEPVRHRKGRQPCDGICKTT